MAVIPSDFDTLAFGVPFYRVQRIGPHLGAALRALDGGAPMAVVGTKLIRAGVAKAAAEGASGVRVTTESENPAAWKLYQAELFRLEAFTSAFHLVRAAK